MKKVLVSLVLLVASTFFCISSFADNMYQQPIEPYGSISVVLSNGYYNVSLAPGQAYKFAWSVSNLNSNNVYVDSISSISAGASDAQILCSASVDISGSTSGWATFINISDQTISGLDLSVSVSCTLYNSNDSWQTPRASLSCTGGTAYSTSYVSNAALSAKLNQILSEIGSSSTVDFLGESGLLYFDQRYFSSVWTGYTIMADSDGLFNLQDANFSGLTLDADVNGYKLMSLSPGTYYIAFSVHADNPINTDMTIKIGVEDISLYDVYVNKDWVESSDRYYVSGFFNLDHSITFRELTLTFKPWVRAGYLYGGIGRASDDAIADSALNPDQDKIIGDVDDAGESQASQEEELWTNINTYKGDLDFSLSGWDSASSGLSYVRDIFMIIWNNSPTQIITLSLMLGIAMLSIGRGVGAAVRVSRKRGDD